MNLIEDTYKVEVSKIKLFRHVREVKKQLKSIKTNEIYVNLGIDYSAYFIMYILTVIENALREGVDKVYYFTREGEFFKQIHDAINEADILGYPIPKSEILEVSRIATYAPSLQEISINGMMRLWSQYPNQSLQAFFKSLHIDITPYMPYLNKYGLRNIDKQLNKIYLQEAIIELFQDKDFIHQLENEIAKKRNLLVKYLKQKGIHQESKKIFIVDIGWRGSIQDNIALLFPDVETVGFYMGLFRPYYQKIINSKKLGFVSSNKEGNNLWYLRHPYPLEMYTNSRNGSVVEYEEIDNGKVKAIRYNDINEDIIYDKYVEKYQNGILFTVPKYLQLIKNYSLLPDELMPYALKSLRKIMVSPSKMLTKPYFELVYNSVYGVGKMEVMSEKLNIKRVLKSITSPKGVRSLIEFIEDSHWPHGLFKNYHLFIVNWFYSRFAKGIYHHYSSLHPLIYSKKIRISLKAYKNIDLNVCYEREELKSDDNCLYIRGNVSIPKELVGEYKILLQVGHKNRKVFYETNQLINNQKYTKDDASFEIKVPFRKNICRSMLCIIILNTKKTVYTIFEV